MTWKWFYYDVETYSPGPKPDSTKDKMIMATVQPVNYWPGKPWRVEGEPTLLTEWGHGIPEMRIRLKRGFLSKEYFPCFLGHNLRFDFTTTAYFMNPSNPISWINWFNLHPPMELMPLLVLANGGDYRGHDKILGGRHDGAKVASWYENEEFEEIEDYGKSEIGPIIDALNKFAKIFKKDMKLPIDYPSASPPAIRLAREEYVRRQNGCCFYCGKLFTEKPDIDLETEAALKEPGRFPKGFLDFPIHLDHDHETGLTRGAVHSYCNAISWVREGR